MPTNRNRKPAYMSNSEAQNRQGTRTSIAFNRSLFAGNTNLSLTTLASATNKHWAKAKKCWDLGLAPTGRIIRCCYSYILQTEGHHSRADSLYYGHP